MGQSRYIFYLFHFHLIIKIKLNFVKGLCQSIVLQNNGLCRKSCNQCFNPNIKATIDVKLATGKPANINLDVKPEKILKGNETISI